MTTYMYMGFLPSVRSRWLDIGQFFFGCLFMDRDRVEVHELAKKEQGQYQAIRTEQAWSIQDLLLLAFGEIFLVRRNYQRCNA